MVFTQVLGDLDAKKLNKPKGKNAVRGLERVNRDIKESIARYTKEAIAASVGKRMNEKERRDKARQRAIVKAMNRNRLFLDAVRAELKALLPR